MLIRIWIYTLSAASLLSSLSYSCLPLISKKFPWPNLNSKLHIYKKQEIWAAQQHKLTTDHNNNIYSYCTTSVIDTHNYLVMNVVEVAAVVVVAVASKLSLLQRSTTFAAPPIAMPISFSNKFVYCINFYAYNAMLKLFFDDEAWWQLVDFSSPSFWAILLLP